MKKNYLLVQFLGFLLFSHSSVHVEACVLYVTIKKFFSWMCLRCLTFRQYQCAYIRLVLQRMVKRQQTMMRLRIILSTPLFMLAILLQRQEYLFLFYCNFSPRYPPFIVVESYQKPILRLSSGGFFYFGYVACSWLSGSIFYFSSCPYLTAPHPSFWQGGL